MVVLHSYWEKIRSQSLFSHSIGFSLFALGFIFLFPQIASPADVSLAWDANAESDLAGYRIYYKKAFSGPPYHGTGAVGGDSPITLPIEDLSDSDSPEYTIQGLSNAETYFYAVTAYNIEEYESGFSNEVYNLCSHIDPPVTNAVFSAYPTMGYQPLTVEFSDETIGDIASRSWDFGDGTKKSGPNPSNTYLQAGTYTVSLIVSGPEGCDVETLEDYITVKPKAAIVNTLGTGQYETTGRGRNRTTSFVLSGAFQAGDEVVIQVYIEDHNGSPLENAVAEITLDGPQVDVLTSAPSNANGMAEAIWETSASEAKGKKGKGGSSSGTASGVYEAMISNVIVSGYVWENNNTSATFEIQ